MNGKEIGFITVVLLILFFVIGGIVYLRSKGSSTGGCGCVKDSYDAKPMNYNVKPIGCKLPGCPELVKQSDKGVNVGNWSSNVPYLVQYKVPNEDYKRLMNKYGPQYFEKLSQYNYSLQPQPLPSGVFPPKAGPLNFSSYGCSGFVPIFPKVPLRQFTPPEFGQTI